MVLKYYNCDKEGIKNVLVTQQQLADNYYFSYRFRRLSAGTFFPRELIVDKMMKKKKKIGPAGTMI